MGDSITVNSLEGTGLEVGWNEGADARNLGGSGTSFSAPDGDGPIPPGYAGKGQTAPATPIQINGAYNPNACNCHSYAWTNSQGDPNDPANAYPMSIGLTKWDNDPTNNIQGYTALNFNDSNQIGDRLIYYAWDSTSNSVIATHSAIVTSIDAQGLATEVESKWGPGPQYTHHPRDIDPTYGSTNPTFVAPNGQIYASRIYYRQNP